MKCGECNKQIISDVVYCDECWKKMYIKGINQLRGDNIKVNYIYEEEE